MDAARAGSEPVTGPFQELHAEAKSAITHGANTLRAVRDRYREAYADELDRLQVLRDDLEEHERRLAHPAAAARSGRLRAVRGAGRADVRGKRLRHEIDGLAGELEAHQAALGRLELAIRSLESGWLFLERGDASLSADAPASQVPADIQMRILEAQEGERARLAQEIHDGPAQSLSNAIFQVEYIDRVVGQDPVLARTELRFLRDLLRRELGDVRSFISQLRPPVLDELGLDGAIRDSIQHIAPLTGATFQAELVAPAAQLGEAAQTVVLRVLQEALQNIRKHASASVVTVATRAGSGEWILEVRDDGHGFDAEAVAARGRRNFGLHFMQERAELIGARFDVRSRPGGGTVVRLVVPVGAEESR